MASSPHPLPAARKGLSRSQRGPVPESAIYHLSRPLKADPQRPRADRLVLGMRDIETPDLPLLDAHQGQPVALAQAVVAALCGITVHQVRQLDIDDLAMLTSDAMWQVEQVCIQMGLPPHFFLQPRAAGEAA